MSCYPTHKKCVAQKKEDLEMDENPIEADKGENEPRRIVLSKGIRFRVPLKGKTTRVVRSTSGASTSRSPVSRGSNYLQLRASSLKSDEFSGLVDISPNKSYVANRWGSRSRNWTLCSIWEPSLTMFLPLAKECVLQMDSALEYLSVGKTQKEMTSILVKAFERLASDEVEQFQESAIMVLIVTQQSVEDGDLKYSQRFEVKVQEAHCASHPEISGFTTTRPPTTKKMSPDSMVAYGGLANILASLVEYLDVLIIFGGYQIEPYGNQGFACILNYNRNEISGMIRIPQNMNVNDSLDFPLVMMEKIQPKLESDHRFKFTYKALKGITKRDVIKHKDFSRESFCRKVTDTLAYSRTRKEFPVPIVRGMDPREIFDVLFDGIPAKPSRPYSPNLDENPADESSFPTAENPSTVLLESSEEDSNNNDLLYEEPKRPYVSCKYIGALSKYPVEPRRSNYTEGSRSQRQHNRDNRYNQGYYSASKYTSLKLFSYLIIMMLVLFCAIIFYVVWQSERLFDQYNCETEFHQEGQHENGLLSYTPSTFLQTWSEKGWTFIVSGYQCVKGVAEWIWSFIEMIYERASQLVTSSLK